MIVERAQDPRFLSNTYLVAAAEAAPGCFIDAGGPVAPLIETAQRLRVEPTHVLLTHHHHDHVAEIGALRERWPQAQVLVHPLERDLVAGATGTIDAGETLEVGALEIRPLLTPGHTQGMLSFLVDGSAVFTGDTLFRGSVGGVRAPGHGTYMQLRDSIMGTLMELAGPTVIHPGHTDATTVEHEWESNPFIRIWRGLDREGSQACTALGEPARLILRAPDYDGGTKAWVRWPDGSDDIVPGSQVV